MAGKKKLEINDPVFAKAYVSQIVSLIENWLLVSDKVVLKRVRELIGKVQVTAPFVMLQEKGWS